MKASPFQRLKALALVAGLFLCLLLPVQARDDSFYLAVYASADMPNGPWLPYGPNMYHISRGWYDFPAFLRVAKSQAGNKPLVIDIECHGLDYLDVLTMPDVKKEPYWDECSMGAFVNMIEASIPSEDLTVIVEACYSGYVFQTTLNHNNLRKYGVIMEDCDHLPTFPIYGIGEITPGISNLVFRQWYGKFGDKCIDLRTLINKPVRPRDLKHSSKETKHVEDLWDESRNHY